VGKEDAVAAAMWAENARRQGLPGAGRWQERKGPVGNADP
jgi:hypothetical protein